MGSSPTGRTMENVLMKIKTKQNDKLNDEEFVVECMDSLIERYPAIKGYVYERLNPDYIQLLIWGDIKLQWDK